jgi:hypothetical protein
MREQILFIAQDKESIRNAVELFISNKINMRIDIEKLEPLSWEAQKAKFINEDDLLTNSLQKGEICAEYLESYRPPLLTKLNLASWLDMPSSGERILLG